MTESKKTAIRNPAESVAKSSAPQPPKKLIPRTAPKAAIPEQGTAPVAEPVAAPVVDAVVPAKPATKRLKKVDVELEATNLRNKKAMSDALAKAQAVKIAQPLGKSVPPPDLPKSKKQLKATKSEKAPKIRKVKLIRDSYAMPDVEYVAIAALKKRLAVLGGEFKKSELLRAGIALLAALGDSELQAVMGRVERIKTGRPAK